MNPITTKVFQVKVDDTYFVHPSADSAKILGNICDKTLHSFEVEGVEYLISTFEVGCIYGSQELCRLFVKNGNTWLASRIYLTNWEWTYLAYGFEAVNAEGYFFDLHRGDDTRFVSGDARQKEMDYWRHKETLALQAEIKEGGVQSKNESNEEPESVQMREMVKHIDQKLKPASIDAHGSWSY